MAMELLEIIISRRDPRAAKGGIKAQSKRGAFGESWWAKRWIDVLESFNIGARLGRGRSYARSGQVLSIDIDKGVIDAQVQGSRPKPYKIQIKIKPLSARQLEKGGPGFFPPGHLCGQTPRRRDAPGHRRSLQGRREALFPRNCKDLQTKCSCPDWSNPCKHIAAVYYLLGEEFDRDPFLIFKLRGMSREELVGLLRRDKRTRGEPDGKTIPRKAQRKRTLQKEEEKPLRHPSRYPLIFPLIGVEEIYPTICWARSGSPLWRQLCPRGWEVFPSGGGKNGFWKQSSRSTKDLPSAEWMSSSARAPPPMSGSEGALKFHLAHR